MPVFDSNILIYAFSTDARRERALTAIAGGGVISVQVLNEFTNVLRKKQKQEWPVIEAALHSLHFRFPDIVPLTGDTHAAAIGVRARTRSSILRCTYRRRRRRGRL